MRRKFKSVTVDLTQYINILFVLNFISKSLFVPDVVPENVTSMYPALIKYIDIK